MVKVSLLYFAWVREAVGVGEELVDLPATLHCAADVIGWLASRGGGYGIAFADASKLRCAVDQVMVALDAPLGRPKEIAFFPPVTGG
jgi:sulfur-carrier protein